jgi:hypothetical protein
MNSYSKDPSWGEALAKLFGALILLAVGIGGFFFIIALIMMLQAYVFTQLWDWFVIPIFKTAPVINYIQAIGLSLVITFYFGGKSYTTYKNNKWWDFLLQGIGATLFVWFVGWIVTLFL